VKPQNITPPIPAPDSVLSASTPESASLRISTRSVVCIGTFDGVHFGHQAVLRDARGAADRLGLPLWAVTFHPHPKSVVKPKIAPPLLTLPEERVALLGAYGADGVLTMTFDDALASTPAADFADSVLAAALKARAIVVGADFGFGFRREGTSRFLSDWGAQRGIDVHVVDLVAVAGQPRPVTSTSIRELFASGRFSEAVELLGHPYPVTGRKIAGAGRGKEMGYPTWNLELDNAKLPPPVGIYAAWTARAVPRPAMAYFGSNPTFGGTVKRLEINVLEGSPDERRPREPIESVWLESYIRPEETFDTADALIQRMTEDEHEARRRLNCPAGHTVEGRRHPSSAD